MKFCPRCGNNIFDINLMEHEVVAQEYVRLTWSYTCAKCNGNFAVTELHTIGPTVKQHIEIDEEEE